MNRLQLGSITGPRLRIAEYLIVAYAVITGIPHQLLGIVLLDWAGRLVGGFAPLSCSSSCPLLVLARRLLLYFNLGRLLLCPLAVEALGLINDRVELVLELGKLGRCFSVQRRQLPRWSVHAAAASFLHGSSLCSTHVGVLPSIVVRAEVCLALHA